MKPIFLLTILLASTSVFAQYFPPAKIQKDIEKVESLDDKCRGGSGDNEKTQISCQKRDLLIKKVNNSGWCWGANFSNAAEYQKYWLPCKLNKN